MNDDLPSKEGARWGPTPQPQAAILPAEYVRLCDEYGDSNTKKAISIYRKVRHDYPHLEVLKRGELSVASDILKRARFSIEQAAKDGRPHSMPETLQRIEKILGEFLAQNPDPEEITRFNIAYLDDTRKGKQYKEDFKKREKKWGNITYILMGIFGFISWLASDKNFVVGLSVAAIVFLISLAFYADSVKGKEPED